MQMRVTGVKGCGRDVLFIYLFLYCIHLFNIIFFFSWQERVQIKVAGN